MKKIWLNYGLLALLIMGPMLLGGYILTLDMVFTPHIPAPTVISNLYILQWLMHIVNYALPSQIIEKLIIFSILLVSGVGMHFLANLVWQHVAIGKKQISEKSVALYTAGVLYVINPFTYERWMAGHYLFLGGYALLPWLIRTCLKFVHKPSQRTAYQLALWLTAIALVSVHILVIALIAILVSLGLNFKTKTKQLLKPLVIFVLTFITLNLFWLIGVVNGSSPINQTIRTIDNSHLEAFTTSANPKAGLLPNVIGLRGFWLERFHRFALPSANTGLGVLIFLLVFSLIVLGARQLWQINKRLALSVGGLGLLGFILAAGVHAPLWGRANRWLILHVPGMRGFREPQKFSVLLVLAYCIFVSFGVNWLANKLASYKPSRANLAWGSLVLVGLLTPTMLLGFGGQLKPVNYPASWYSFNNQLKTEKGSYKVLFLPWHQYMSFDFNPRIIANPAPNFFDKPVIAGDNSEFGTVFRDTYNPTSDYIEQKILGQAGIPDMGSRLAKINVKYVLLANAPDTNKYDFLNHQSQLNEVVYSSSLRVYLNTEYKT